MCRYEEPTNFKLTPRLILASDEQIGGYTFDPILDHGQLISDFYISIMLTIAIILFIVGSVIAIANAYYCGKCFSVGQPKEYAHFSPCTFY